MWREHLVNILMLYTHYVNIMDGNQVVRKQLHTYHLEVPVDKQCCILRGFDIDARYTFNVHLQSFCQ